MLKKLFKQLTTLLQQGGAEPKPQHEGLRGVKKRQSKKQVLSPETDNEDSLLCHISYQIDGQEDLCTVNVSREPTPDEALSLAKRHNRELFGNLRTGEIVVTDIFCVSDDDLKLE